MKTDNKSYLGVSESFVFHSEQETTIKVIEITKVQSSGSMFVQVKPSGKKCRVKKKNQGFDECHLIGLHRVSIDFVVRVKLFLLLYSFLSDSSSSSETKLGDSVSEMAKCTSSSIIFKRHSNDR